MRKNPCINLLWIRYWDFFVSGGERKRIFSISLIQNLIWRKSRNGKKNAKNILKWGPCIFNFHVFHNEGVKIQRKNTVKKCDLRMSQDSTHQLSCWFNGITKDAFLSLQRLGKCRIFDHRVQTRDIQSGENPRNGTWNEELRWWGLSIAMSFSIIPFIPHSIIELTMPRFNAP